MVEVGKGGGDLGGTVIPAARAAAAVVRVAGGG